MQLLRFGTVTVDSRGDVIARKSATARVLYVGLGDGAAIEMVSIPGGTFVMGSPCRQGYDDERPQHEVSVSAFLMGRYPVTQAQWEALMGERPLCRFHGPERPVDNVSWVAAAEFCERLSQRSGRGFRLPSEAQWEYACRAGTTTPFHFGETLTTSLANYNGAFIFRREPTGLYRHVTTDVGSFPPNAFGLYDMHGNLWEWCADAWHPDYAGAPADGTVWQGDRTVPERVARGGSWHEPPDLCRSALRMKFRAHEGDDFNGFRLASWPRGP